MGLLDFLKKSKTKETFIFHSDKPKKERPLIADKNCWKNSPLPSTTIELEFKRTFTKEEIEKINKGLIPKEMEDKWFIFCEGQTINIHRSWTGIQIYKLDYESISDNEIEIKRTLVNADKEQYNIADNEQETKLLNYLIDRLLLARPVKFPVLENIPTDQQSIFKHTMVGHGRAEGEK